MIKNIPPFSVGLVLHQEIPEYTPGISLGGLQNKMWNFIAVPWIGKWHLLFPSFTLYVYGTTSHHILSLYFHKGAQNLY